MSRLEGSGVDQLRQAIKQLGWNAYDRLEFATVIGTDPIRLKIDNSIDLEADDVVITKHLTDYSVTLRYADGTTADVTVENGLIVGERVILSSMNEGQGYIVLDRI